jgi:hypothetical protein
VKKEQEDSLSQLSPPVSVNEHHFLELLNACGFSSFPSLNKSIIKEDMKDKKYPSCLSTTFSLWLNQWRNKSRNK